MEHEYKDDHERSTRHGLQIQNTTAAAQTAADKLPGTAQYSQPGVPTPSYADYNDLASVQRGDWAIRGKLPIVEPWRAI